MKKCNACGETFDKDYAFCPMCGADLVDAPNVCSNCGQELHEGFTFCPSCGAKSEEEEKTNEPVKAETNETVDNDLTHIDERSDQDSVSEEKEVLMKNESAETNPLADNTHLNQFESFDTSQFSPQGNGTSVQDSLSAAMKNFSGNELLKNKKIVAAVIAAVLVIATLSFISYTSPKELEINEGKDIEAYVGESTLFFSVAEGLGAFYDSEIEWSYDNPDLVKVENGCLEATYDKNAFNASGNNSGLQEDNNSITTFIHGTLKKGLRTWEGDAKVIVLLREEIHFNGQVYTEPSASTDSFVEVTAADDYSTYFYFKSLTNPKNDISFIVDAGKETRVYVPCDKYEVLYACGETWYGPEIVFGPNTSYAKFETTMEFTPDTYGTLKMGVLFGNSKSQDINANEFPDPSTESSSEAS